MSINSVKKTLRWSGVVLFIAFLASFPLLHAYVSWDSQRLIRAYGVEPASVQRPNSFPGEYVRSRLKPGATTKDEVHKIIHTYWKLEQSRENDGTELESYYFDPLLTLFGQIGYREGKFIPNANFERGPGRFPEIQIVTFIGGLLLFAASFAPFQRLLSKQRTF